MSILSPSLQISYLTSFFFSFPATPRNIPRFYNPCDVNISPCIPEAFFHYQLHFLKRVFNDEYSALFCVIKH